MWVVALVGVAFWAEAAFIAASRVDAFTERVTATVAKQAFVDIVVACISGPAVTTRACKRPKRHVIVSR
jgi:hypothetical protein